MAHYDIFSFLTDFSWVFIFFIVFFFMLDEFFFKARLEFTKLKKKGLTFWSFVVKTPNINNITK